MPALGNAQAGAIRLYVQTEDSIGLEGATVMLYSESKMLQKYNSDMDGQCVFKPLMSGKYEIRILHPSFCTYVLKDIPVITEGTVGLSITLQPHIKRKIVTEYYTHPTVGRPYYNRAPPKETYDLYNARRRLIADTTYQLTPKAYKAWLQVADSVVQIVFRDMGMPAIALDAGVEGLNIMAFDYRAGDSVGNMRIVRTFCNSFPVQYFMRYGVQGLMSFQAHLYQTLTDAGIKDNHTFYLPIDIRIIRPNDKITSRRSVYNGRIYIREYEIPRIESYR